MLVSLNVLPPFRVRMTEYRQRETHHKGINRFLGVGFENGYSFPIALLSIPESDALKEARDSLELKEGRHTCRRETRKEHPKSQQDEEYYGHQSDMPVEISLRMNLKRWHSLTRSTSLAMQTLTSLLTSVQTGRRLTWAVYQGSEECQRGIDESNRSLFGSRHPWGGWLEWGKEGLSKKHSGRVLIQDL